MEAQLNTVVSWGKRKSSPLLKMPLRAAEMAHNLEDPASGPNTICWLSTVHDSHSKVSDTPFQVYRHQVHIHTCRQDPHADKIKMNGWMNESLKKKCLWNSPKVVSRQVLKCPAPSRLCLPLSMLLFVSALAFNGFTSIMYSDIY